MKKSLDLKENRSLINLILDVAELDPTAKENESFLEKTYSKILEKVENYALAKKIAESEAARYRAEAKHNTAAAKACDNIVEAIKYRAVQALKAANTDRLYGKNKHLISRREMKELVILDSKLIPEEFKTVEITEKLDTKALTQALRDGREVPGAMLKDKTGVLIK